jgi:hypothetical protein
MLPDSDTCSHGVLNVEMREWDGATRADAVIVKSTKAVQKNSKVAQSVGLLARPQRL